MTQTQQPEALRVAEWLINAPHKTTHGDMLIAGRELRRLHACVQELEAQQAVRGYDSGIQTGNRVTLIFNTQEDATRWFEGFTDAYDAAHGTKSIALPIPLAAAPTPPAQYKPKYRLLERGVDAIELADEFLKEDGVTWVAGSKGIFVGMKYQGDALLPARQPLGIGAANSD